MTTTKKRQDSRVRRIAGREPEWALLSDEELLNVRICDLGLRLEGTLLVQRVRRLHRELDRRVFRFRPHCWLSEEWFSPEGVPGIAIPFYLAHPRLMLLEHAQMLEVEGGTEDSCMRILRHEAGHALDTAYRLHRRPRWRKVFGKYSEPYPETYQPKPYSRSYVLHLDLWYAQSHPAEDFAETFAVWLGPRKRWRARYRGWPALRKLEYLDELMGEIRDRKPLIASRAHVEPLRSIRKTLARHYEEKRERYGVNYPYFYDRDLRKLFSDAAEHAAGPSAARFLARNRKELCRDVARWTGQYRYTIDEVLRDMIQRCRKLNLRLDRPETQAKRDALVMLTVQSMNYLHGGHHRVVL